MHLSQKIQTQHELLCDSLLCIFNHGNFLKFCHLVLFFRSDRQDERRKAGKEGDKMASCTCVPWESW